MNKTKQNDRRQFLRGLSGLLAGGAATSMLPQLELMGRAMAASPAAVANDYRAIVCIFLFGGNDSFNLLIPHAQNEYDLYSKSRGGVFSTSNNAGLGIARDKLTRITDTSGKTWGLHPSFAPAASLFQNGELAFMANVGTLVEPMTKAQFESNAKRYPDQLYSHNDQQQQWMRGHCVKDVSLHGLGWGGRAGDALRSRNNGTLPLAPVISISGTNLYQNGTSVLPFVLSSGGASRLSRFYQGNAGDKIRYDTLRELLQKNYTSIMQDQYGVVGETSIVVNDKLREELLDENDGNIATVFPENDGLGSQLKMIARMIKVSQRASIGHKRQIYFASIGGFDTHENQMSSHERLFGSLSNSLVAFRNALNEIGALNNVTTFSMSDFGRTLNSNGNGTDHGWGGVQFMMGGASAKGGPLHGRKVYGNYPLLELVNDQAVGRGRMLPTTSIQQYGATLAKWMGVTDADINTIFSGVGNFNTRNLGFLV